jgi:hypothetical protein
MDDEELEPQVLTYREFQRRRTLLAWHERRRAHDADDAEVAHERALGWVGSPNRQPNRRRGNRALSRGST